MRTILIIPIAVIATAAVGIAATAPFGNAHIRDMILAAVACLIAAFLSQVPISLARGSDQLATSQAGLVATMVHLFTAATFAAILIFTHKVTGFAFIAWLMAFYVATLTVIAIGIVQSIRKAAPVKSAQS